MILPNHSKITISGNSVSAKGVKIRCAGAALHNVFRQDLLKNAVGVWVDERPNWMDIRILT